MDPLSEEAQGALNIKYQADRKAIFKWYSEKLPSVKLETIGPSEYSGYSEGGAYSQVADSDASSLAAFREFWEMPGYAWKASVRSYGEWLHRFALVACCVPDCQCRSGFAGGIRQMDLF